MKDTRLLIVRREDDRSLEVLDDVSLAGDAELFGKIGMNDGHRFHLERFKRRRKIGITVFVHDYIVEEFMPDRNKKGFPKEAGNCEFMLLFSRDRADCSIRRRR